MVLFYCVVVAGCSSHKREQETNLGQRCSLLTTHRLGQLGEDEGLPVAILVWAVHTHVCPTGGGHAGVVWTQRQGVDPLQVLEMVDGLWARLYAPYIHRSLMGRENGHTGSSWG